MSVTIFKSRLAKRFFAMFIACALIPILALAGITYYRVTRQLEDQAFERLRQSAKSHGLSIFEHLLLAEQHLEVIQEILSPDDDGSFSALPRTVMERNQELYTGLAWARDQKIGSSWGHSPPPLVLNTVRKMVASKEILRLMTWNNGTGWPAVALIRRMEGRGDGGDFLIGVLNGGYLWGIEKGNILPVSSEFTVWDDQGQRLFSSLADAHPSNTIEPYGNGSRPSGQIEVELEAGDFLAAYWSPFLKPKFAVPFWTVMILEPKDHIYQPLQSFQAIFPLVVLMAFFIVVWLSSRAIRKSLVPIESLMEGARQVADRQFSHRVVVESRDEFKDLASVFNHMTRQLDIQFKGQVARSDMDRAILSVLDIEQIISTSLTLSKTLFTFQTAAISIVESSAPVTGRSYIHNDLHLTSPPPMMPFQMNPQELTLLERHREWFRIDAGEELPAYLSILQQPDVACFYIFPIWIQKRLFAFVSFGVHSPGAYDEIDLNQIRGVADHLAVAFTNSNLVQELKDLNLGTLYALARTVDAKSAWTAGHSVRVTQVAMHIAAGMGLPPSSQEELRRAGLLHDIGKIGIPLSILDKNGELSAEEYDIIKGHPSIGARILTPIQAYADIIPIIEQHHEQYDGQGYPFGLAKEQIHILARILALADTYDALVSDRPYRQGLSVDAAMQIITNEAGHQFDPRVVEEFRHMGQPAIPPVSILMGAALLDTPPGSFEPAAVSAITTKSESEIKRMHP